MSKDAIPILVPPLGESISEATIARWRKSEGEAVVQDETLIELETEKVTLEVNAPADGLLKEVRVAEGTAVKVGDVVGVIAPAEEMRPEPMPARPEVKKESLKAAKQSILASSRKASLSPASRKIIADHALDPRAIKGTGKEGRITKGDVTHYLQTIEARPSVNETPLSKEERVPMSRLRQTIAARLKQAQNTAACLTTFNEIDMASVIAVRDHLKESFEKKYGAKLGFMSFFVKACLVALKEIPAVNAHIDGTDIVYKNHYDIGIAVGALQGLVVPVVREADQLSFADLEMTIGVLASKAREGALALDDLTGGTFTITNGGVYGSLLSTPILNPPQSAILGMHKIEKRPVVIDDAIVIRPMMYVALTYDHRLIDGREAVTFLTRIKECIEEPERMLLNV
jgi:2-oxoglutarate dehydrogenase E2 component (dihydrolipoamide succinyltransferase)